MAIGKLYGIDIGGGGGVSAHADLTGLSADDHTQYLLTNGTRDISGNVTQENGLYFATDEIRARDGGGLNLKDDSGTLGVFIEDGGYVGIHESSPSYPLHLSHSPGASTSRTAYIYTAPAGTATNNNQNHYGLYSYVNSSFDQSTYNCSLWGAYFDLNASGSYGVVRGLHINSIYTGTSSINSIIGTYSYAGINGVASLGNGYGINSSFMCAGGSTVTHAYGIYSTVGLYGAGSSLTNAYGVRTHLDRQVGTATNGYLFYGTYNGTWGTKWGIYLSGETRNYFSGDVGVKTNDPTTGLDVNDDVIRLRTSKTVTNPTDTGNVGDICWDSNYIYVCIAADTWKRASLSGWGS